MANKLISEFKDPLSGIVDRDDIIQSGYEGLWKACLRFDESKGYEFSTFAVPYIKGTIMRMLRDETDTLKTSRTYKDIRNVLRKYNFTLPLDDSEIAVILAEGKFSLKQLMEYSEPEFLSLDYVYDTKDGEGATLGDIIPSPYSSNFENNFSDKELEDIVDSVLSYIKPNYHDIVEEWLYAEIYGPKINQSELARKYGVSQASVSRLFMKVVDLFKLHKKEILELCGV